jgi:hypothetical protein
MGFSSELLHFQQGKHSPPGALQIRNVSNGHGTGWLLPAGCHAVQILGFHTPDLCNSHVNI